MEILIAMAVVIAVGIFGYIRRPPAKHVDPEDLEKLKTLSKQCDAYHKQAAKIQDAASTEHAAIMQDWGYALEKYSALLRKMGAK